ncbi:MULTISPECIES: Lrp/AsnC family transcriptional regulator [Salibacter]|jgi:Lrp/AsnC family leucine-responsive transcriptional regulator|nr:MULTISPECIES: Lrp/AsnC family transcriptional regulator [Salibacter]MDR9399531.1 Lrp/AsnC family transcriptional regulator [Salibacter sp.]MDR9487778.1 Lrp/AsnC family transcriptional regulator [Salibacter sp.]
MTTINFNTKMALDETDKMILKVLQENGRITNLQLSKEIGLSPAPTLERVRKLERNGFIDSFHAKLNHEKLGYGLKIVIQVSLVRQIENAVQKFLDQINEIDEIIECEQVTGDFDYYIKVLVKDIAEYDKLVNDKLSRIEEIGQMRSSVILSTVKDSSRIPVK